MLKPKFYAGAFARLTIDLQGAAEVLAALLHDGQAKLFTRAYSGAALGQTPAIIFDQYPIAALVITA